MNYDKIIVEMLSRIQALEEEVELLSGRALSEVDSEDEKDLQKRTPKTTTADIRDYISSVRSAARAQNKESITLKASDIHNALGLTSRYPMVCNAMRQCMRTNDVILHETASGYSSTLAIKYNCMENAYDDT